MPDPIFLKRFSVETSIQYQSKVTLRNQEKKAFSTYWKRIYPKAVRRNSRKWGKKFTAFFEDLEKSGSDSKYCQKVMIRLVNKKMGYGVFATQTIRPHTILHHYAGVLRLDKKIATSNDSVFCFPDYPKFSLDGKRKGCWTRFMNHSDKKANVHPWEHYLPEGPRIVFVSTKTIHPEEQLLYSYGDMYWDEENFLE